MVSQTAWSATFEIAPPKPSPHTSVDLAFDAIDADDEKSARDSIAKINDPLLRKTLTWYMLRDLSGAGDTEEIDQFLDANPNWPDRDRILRRAEELQPISWPPGSVIARYHQRPPISDAGRGRLAVALIRAGQFEKGIPLARQIWVDGDFTGSDEREFYRVFRQYLRKSDHIARLDRLLWDGRFGATRRMFSRVPDDVRKLAEARFLLRHRRGNVDKAIERVPESLRNHEGLVYERLRWRRRKGRSDSARELLVDIFPGLTRPDLWAEERIVLARRAFEDGHISEAYELVDYHGVDSDEALHFSEAEWFAGWIALRFLNEPEWAYDHFRAVYKAVSYPISRARGAFWSGRAAVALGKQKQAETWFKIAASFPETYYGQLAADELNPDGALALPEEKPRNQAVVDKLLSNELAQVASRLVDAGHRDRVRPFVLHLADMDPSMDWQRACAIFARSLGRPDLAIHVAKAARLQGDLLIDSSHPTLAALGIPLTDEGTDVEPALVHAVIRQESAYFVSARSHAGALGLMQVMPATAKVVARRSKLEYDRTLLRDDPSLNLAIGRAYLGDLIEEFSGSYILALVAYNAGPARARRWVRAFGDPRDPAVDPVDWIEMIPFDETRNYVQRVLENLQVYRAILAPKPLPLQIASDLRR
ncbi:MAG: lytic transglycosylase domain-containing protein [Rhodospirillales bacterium]